MSARDRRRRPPAATVPGARPRRGAARSGVLWRAGLAALVLALAGAAIMARRPPQAPPPSARLSPADSAAAAMDAWPAYQRAVSLWKSGADAQSLAYYRRAIAGVSDDFWQLHFNYGSALYNVTLAIEDRRGVHVAVARSSWERVALLRQALAEFAAAERLCRTRADLAFVRGQSARMLWVWGLPWETLTAYRTAQAANPSDLALASQADGYMRGMAHPERSGAAVPERAVGR